LHTTSSDPQDLIRDFPYFFFSVLTPSCVQFFFSRVGAGRLARSARLAVERTTRTPSAGAAPRRFVGWQTAIASGDGPISLAQRNLMT
jgi:hypothetical protein